MPTTIIAGDVSPASVTRSAMFVRFPMQIRCCGVVACEMTATAVIGLRPTVRSPSAISATLLSPIKKISVSVGSIIDAKSISVVLSFRLCAVITRNEVATPRCVTGIPAYAAPAIADVTPGTTTNEIPCSRRNMPSSPPRPNT